MTTLAQKSTGGTAATTAATAIPGFNSGWKSYRLLSGKALVVTKCRTLKWGLEFTDGEPRATHASERLGMQRISAILDINLQALRCEIEPGETELFSTTQKWDTAAHWVPILGP